MYCWCHGSGLGLCTNNFFIFSLFTLIQVLLPVVLHAQHWYFTSESPDCVFDGQMFSLLLSSFWESSCASWVSLHVEVFMSDLGFWRVSFFSFLFLEFFATHDGNLGLRIWIWADSTTLLCEEKWASVVVPTQSVLLYNWVNWDAGCFSFRLQQCRYFLLYIFKSVYS